MMVMRGVSMKTNSFISQFGFGLSIQDYHGKIIFLYSLAIMMVQSLSLKLTKVNAEKYCKVKHH